jgi:hypothetical protein
MVREERRLVDGHVCEIKGSDHQVYVDGECVTHEVLSYMGGVREDVHGMRMPYGNNEVFSSVEQLLRAEKLSVVVTK